MASSKKVMSNKGMRVCMEVMVELLSNKNEEVVWPFHTRFDAEIMNPESKRPMNLKIVWRTRTKEFQHLFDSLHAKKIHDEDLSDSEHQKKSNKIKRKRSTDSNKENDKRPTKKAKKFI